MNNKKDIFLFLDLLFFSILAAISEIMSYKLLEFWNSSFYFSFSMVLCLISMIRWGAVGVVVALSFSLQSVGRKGDCHIFTNRGNNRG